VAAGRTQPHFPRAADGRRRSACKAFGKKFSLDAARVLAEAAAVLTRAANGLDDEFAPRRIMSIGSCACGGVQPLQRVGRVEIGRPGSSWR
jgi:hypothetical protein